MKEELLSALRHELGEVIEWDELCPDVFYIGVQLDPDCPYQCGEYCLALPDAPISQEARALGKAADGVPGLLYPVDPPVEGGWTAILYEVCKIRSRHDLPPLEGWSLADAAMEGMELCSAYFGPFPVPPRTPWGWTLRHRALDNGIYWMETDQCVEVLAVCHPIWSSEFSDGVTQTGKKLTKESADSEDLNYLFFNRETSCAAVFELLKARPQWLDRGMVRRAELMNAVWQYQPMYAAAYNAQEQKGLHDGLGILLQMLGEDSEPQGSVEHMVSLDSRAGTDFIGFWK